MRIVTTILIIVIMIKLITNIESKNSWKIAEKQ